MKSKHIALIGPMASGKSTVGLLLSQALNLALEDTDALIVGRCKKSIAEIFKVMGETYFRQKESQILQDLVKLPKRIIATGGGMVLSDININLLKQHCFVIYLKASIETQLQRIIKDSTRPLLQVNDKQEVLIELQIAREPLYNVSADFIINVDSLSAKEIVNGILKHYQNTTG